MFYALVNGEKLEAIPKSKGICPACGEAVYSRCGEVNLWHWAHVKESSCETNEEWYEPETEWHRKWKLVFGKDRSEIVIEKGGVKHRADILTQTLKNDVVIELQNSPISDGIISKRETFYGRCTLWILNGVDFRDNFSIYDNVSRFSNYRDFATPAVVNNSNWNQFTFNWEWPYAKRSWEASARPVFIDFGDDYLFWMKNKEYCVSFGSTGKLVPKACFVKKYGGDISLL
jgi:competence CoiA-like predicted nuclease